MNEALKKEWCRLFDLGIQIKKIKPWESIAEDKLFVLHLKKRNRPVVLHFMGNATNNIAIFIYQTRKAQKNLSNMLYGTVDVIDPLSFLPTLQEGIGMDFNNRDELSDEEYQLVKNLGYSFRGKKQWLSFTAYVSGFVPRALNLSEIKLLADCLEMILANENALKEMAKSDDNYCHLYDNKAHEMLPFDLYDENKGHPEVFKDKVLIKRLNKLPKQPVTLELSYIYTNHLIENKRVVPMIVCSETKNQSIVFHDMIENPKLLEEKIVRYVTNMVKQVGRPERIVVRLEDVYLSLADLCEKLDIELVMSAQLPSFELAVNGLMDVIGMPQTLSE